MSGTLRGAPKNSPPPQASLLHAGEGGDFTVPSEDPMLFLVPLAHAAPWPVEVAAPLPEPPAHLAIYAVHTTDPSDRLAALQDVFGVAGTPAWFDHLGGVAKVVDGGLFAWAFSDGGSTFHDDSESDAEVPMQPRRIDAVWDEADAVLFELGLFDASPFELFPLRVARSEATVTVPSGRTFGPWTTSQIAVYGYRLDGYDVLGPGGETTVEFGGEGVIAVSDNQRSMEIAEVIVPDAPGVALRRWADRADVEHRWSMYRAYMPDIDRVRIDEVRLGYFAPAMGAACHTLEPVYQIHGQLLGRDARGRPATTEFLWWEPVRADRSIPSLHIFASR